MIGDEPLLHVIGCLSHNYVYLHGGGGTTATCIQLTRPVSSTLARGPARASVVIFGWQAGNMNTLGILSSVCKIEAIMQGELREDPTGVVAIVLTSRVSKRSTDCPVMGIIAGKLHVLVLDLLE